MKRLLLCMTLLILFTGPALAGGRLNIVATLTDYGWLAEQVGGDHVKVKTLARGSQDPHYVDAKPSYLPALHKADLLLLNGLDLELGWLPPLLRQAGNRRIQPGNDGYVDLGAFVEPIEVPHGGADRSMGDVHPHGNPHYNLDPLVMADLATALGEILGKADPDRAEAYRANARTTAETLKRLDAEVREVLEPVRGQPIVTYHSTQNYFFKRYGLLLLGFVEPKPGIKPSPRSLLALEKEMKRRGSRIILMEPYQDVKLAERVAKDTGARLLVCPSYVGGSPEAAGYPEVLLLMARRLAEASRG